MKVAGKALLALLLASVPYVQAAEYTDRLIVKMRDSTARTAQAMSASQASDFSRTAGVQLAAVRAMGGGAQVMRLPGMTPLVDVQAIAQRLQADPNIEYAEPDRIRRPMLVPNDTNYAAEQWYLHGAYGINAPAAWDITTGSSSVVVAVIDTGITTHSELPGSRIVPGYDFITNSFVANDGDGRDNDPSDPGDWVTADDVSNHPGLCNTVANSSWHGTAIAGLIAAASDNAAGVAGINWAAKILPVRVLGKCAGYMSDIVDGMRWAAGLSVPGVPANANPAKVLNLSLGGGGACQQTEQTAINEIISANKVVVVAAGNESADVANTSPANCTGVIVVAATTISGGLSPISNRGSQVTISAPGGDGVQSEYLLTNTGLTVPGAEGYAYYYGTSAAAAAVSGVVSLMFSVNAQLAPSQVRSILRSTASPFGVATCDTSICGAGIVNAAAAVSLANTTTGTASSSSSSGGGGGGGGGGCVMRHSADFDPLLGLLLVFAGTRLAWRRKRQQ